GAVGICIGKRSSGVSEIRFQSTWGFEDSDLLPVEHGVPSNRYLDKWVGQKSPTKKASARWCWAGSRRKNAEDNSTDW
ncbi:MAG: hypothetical protein P8M80_09570, partial [Pirellulaceae bacterium]|nr:hypothetical protein [Pirellulaceae bacterium]